MAEDHRESDHSHALSSTSDMRYVLVTLGLISAFLVGEVIAAVLGHSLALFADAAHMSTDVVALTLSAWAIRLLGDRPKVVGLSASSERRSSRRRRTVSRSQRFPAHCRRGIQRLINPHHVRGSLVLVVALVGALNNVVATWVLSKANRRSLNVRGAYVHIVTDLYAFVGTAIAGLIIVLTGFNRADSIASLIVVVLMAYAHGDCCETRVESCSKRRPTVWSGRHSKSPLRSSSRSRRPRPPRMDGVVRFAHPVGARHRRGSLFRDGPRPADP